MKVAAFPRNSLSRRQLLREDPQARPLLDKFEGDTLERMQVRKQYVMGEERAGGHWHTGFAVATGAAGLALGALWTPWAGLGMGVVSALFARQAVKSYGTANAHAGDLKSLDQLAERTQKNLVQPQADGTVVDRRFLETGLFHDAQEVSKNGQVLTRSVRVEAHDVSAVADVPAGTVTVKGPLGESTFPGTLTLPTVDDGLMTVVRTDQEIQGYNRTEMRFDSDGTLDLDMRHKNSNWHIGNSVEFRKIDDGLIAGLDEAGNTIAIQAPLTHPKLSGDYWLDRHREVSIEVSWGLTLYKRAEVPKLEPLEAYDLSGEPLVGGRFHPHRGNCLEISLDRGKVHFDSEATGKWSVPGELQEDGRIRMKQSGLEVYQTLQDDIVRLTVEGGPAEVTLEDNGNGAPRAECGGNKVSAGRTSNGSYVIDLKSGSITVKPAITLKRLTARGD